MGCAKMAKFVNINDAIINVENIFYVYIDKAEVREAIKGYTHCIRISYADNNSLTIYFGSEEEALEILDELKAQLVE